jgi:hypothetical protein
MRVLVLSNSEWDDSNSFGNTFSNLLGFVAPNDLANIYCRNGKPLTKSCQHFLCMGETQIIRYILYKSDFPIVRTAPSDGENLKQTIRKNRIKDFIRLKRWIVFFWGREFIWKICRWKGSTNLDRFITDFNPDILVLPTYSFSYINKLAIHIHRNYNIPVVSYISDDEYSLRQLSFSPLYWVNRLYQRIWIKRGFDISKVLYVISDKQKKYFSDIISCPCKVITKGLDFATPRDVTKLPHNSSLIKLLYVGNIGSGRWRSLLYLAESINRYNENGIKFELNIYTATPISSEQKRSFALSSVYLHSAVPSSKVPNLISESDILVHAESFKTKDKMMVWQSFSTKIVDYLHSNRCILAIGPSDIASISFLKENQCAIIVDDKSNIDQVLEHIYNNQDILNKFAISAWNVGKEKCDKKKIHNILHNDFITIIKSQNNE